MHTSGELLSRGDEISMLDSSSCTSGYIDLPSIFSTEMPPISRCLSAVSDDDPADAAAVFIFWYICIGISGGLTYVPPILLLPPLPPTPMPNTCDGTFGG